MSEYEPVDLKTIISCGPEKAFCWGTYTVGKCGGQQVLELRTNIPEIENYLTHVRYANQQHLQLVPKEINNLFPIVLAPWSRRHTPLEERLYCGGAEVLRGAYRLVQRLFTVLILKKHSFEILYRNRHPNPWKLNTFHERNKKNKEK